MPSEIFKPNEAQTSEWLHRTENSPEPHENEPELLEYTVRFSHFVCSEYPNILKKLVTFNDNDNDQFEKLDLKLTNLLPEGQPAKIVSLREVQTQAILFLKSMTERVGSDIQRR